MSDSHPGRPARYFVPIALALIAIAPGVARAHPGHAYSADPEGQTTLQETIRPLPGEGFRELEAGAGEPYIVRTELGRAQAQRERRRRSLLFFAHLTDPQIVDEMSPARVEFFDPVGGPVSAAWRPQEAFGPYVWDQAVRNVNRNRTSPVRQGDGRRNRLDMTILTGDLIDNQQLNEAGWYVDTLEGRSIDPFSGQPVSPDNPCPQATPPQEQRLNEDVANRRYTGVQDYDDYPGVPQARYSDYWDPDQPAPSGPYAAFPSYPGLMERAQLPFQAEGLQGPWYTARGNHDALVQGNAPANNFFNSIAVGCIKVFPSATVDPASFAGQDFEQIFAQLTDPAFLTQLLAGGGLTAPDPNRRFLGVREFKEVHGPEDRQHGFGYVDEDELEASNGAASYYAFNARKNLRLISIDTVAEGGESNGNVDDPQYRWLRRELDRNSSIEYGANGRLRRDGHRDRLIILYGHHTLESMGNPNIDEAAGPCEAVQQPGCDHDPRASTPIHNGLSGSANVRDLLLRFPNVIAYVSGHTHANAIEPFQHESGTGFWQLNTASLVDPPQQLRSVELMANRDGTLSIFNTVIDHAAPIDAPAAGTPAGVFSEPQLASISRLVSFNDPQSDIGEYLGGPRDRNVELIVGDPRALAREAARRERRQRRARRRGGRRAPALTGRVADRP